MALTVTVNLDVPPLNDNGVAFANSAAWVNYWAKINLTGTFDPADNDKYTESAYNNTLQPFSIEQEGNVQQLPTYEQFQSLLLAYQTLNTNYKELLDVLKAIGLITQST